jgi:hypothetical protein
MALLQESKYALYTEVIKFRNGYPCKGARKPSHPCLRSSSLANLDQTAASTDENR